MLFQRTSKAATTLAGMIALVLAACGGGSETDVCGDQVCSGGEDATSCAQDCGCGNGVADPGEHCDGSDLGDGTCLSETGRGGSLGCNADCTFDVTECTLAGCGDGVIGGGELCDGSAFGDRSCESVGFGGGSLVCTADCRLDTSTCCTDTCPTDGAAECLGDTLRACAPGANGCLAWQITDCAASNGVCQTTGTTAACSCIDRCETIGDTRCEGPTIETCVQSGACLDWAQTTDCNTTNQICAEAPSGPVCVLDVGADTCADAYPLSSGLNIVGWSAAAADYLTTQPSCNTTAMLGPDVVMSYTAPANGFVRITMDKPEGSRQVLVATSGACGATTPELACTSEANFTAITNELAVTAGTAYHFYARDTSGGVALPNPLIVNFEEVACTAMDADAVSLSPPNDGGTPDRTPVITARIEYPVDPTTGTISVTGDQGTILTYDLSTSPVEVSFLDNSKTIMIDPGVVFAVGEQVTVTWTGLEDATCGTAIDAPTWTFEILPPPCAPGRDGMVGNSTMTRIATGGTFSGENYVAVDAAPDGYVYVGGPSNLYRTPKAGGATTTISQTTSAMLGYDMLIAGNEIYTLEGTTSSTADTNLLFRLSTNSGATLNAQNYADFPSVPNDDLRSIAFRDGHVYMATQESTAGTQIWRVPTAATAAQLPLTPELVATIDEAQCAGLAIDDRYFFLACGTDQRLVRVNRTTLVVELMTAVFNFNTTKNTLIAHDFDNDGLADALYVQTDTEQVTYVCKPSDPGPFLVDVLATFGSGTANYGLAFDPVDNALWAYDDDTREFVKIK